MPVDCGIGFGFKAAVAIQVYLHRRVVVGLQVLDIDLASDALRAVLDARCALAHRDALHPGTRHIAQGVGQRCAHRHREPFAKHLHILPAEAQQLYLSGANSSVVIVHIDRGTIDKALAKVAASSTEQLGLTQVDTVLYASHTAAPCRALRLDRHGTQRGALDGVLLRHRFSVA